MKILISVDMEGITGVTCPDDVEYGQARWEYSRHLMMSDVNSAVEGFATAGATEIVVNDAHSTKRNLLLDELDDRAAAIIGTHKELGMLEGAEDADAVAFLGYHTGAGRQGVLSHTYIGQTIVSVSLNGDELNEGRMNSLLAAEIGVPVVLVTGDDLTCQDARSWAPQAEVVAVKTCIDRYTARCLTPRVSAQLISAAASRALDTISPVQSPTGPFNFEVEFDAVQPVVACTAIPGVERRGDRCVGFTLPTMREAVRCFKVVTVVAGASTEMHYG